MAVPVPGGAKEVVEQRVTRVEFVIILQAQNRNTCRICVPMGSIGTQ